MRALSHRLCSLCSESHEFNVSIRFTTILASLATNVQTSYYHQPQEHQIQPSIQNPTTLEKHHQHQNSNQPIITQVQTQTPKESLLSIIKSCTTKLHLLQIHAHIVRTSLLLDSTICLQFLSLIALSPLKTIAYSRQFFDRIPKPTAFQYNTMIRAYSKSGSPEEGFYMYRDLLRRGLCADALASSFVIKSCIRVKLFVGGIQVHSRILRDGHQSDSLLLTTLMDLYSICRKYAEARKVFDDMPKRDAVAWNVLISCCLHNNRTRDALGMFDIMQSEAYGCQPDDVTCLLMLQACANLNALEFGERVHKYIEEHGYGCAGNVCNSLISMYSRCGCLDKAYEVFKGMRDKNVVSWSAMISGLAVNGYGKDAIEAFGEMQKMGVLPDDQTFTGLLCACSHCGLVDEGLMFFERMSKQFGVIPNIHHYGCMVDLLGRAGRLDQAYQLIMSMDIKPDPTMWRTLLGSCRIHGQDALAERVIDHLIELKAQEAGDYILLMNIYSSAGNWEKLKEVRKFMKEKSIQTTPGCSTIELKGVVHEFIVNDASHPRKVEIYKMLDEINGQLKIAGHVADVSSELHRLGPDEKGHILSYHSEKLALAFAVLVTPPGTPIRVANNLRICVDCHNFGMALSEVYNREVIIRDRTRFHHFREGRCSCNGYW